MQQFHFKLYTQKKMKNKFEKDVSAMLMYVYVKIWKQPKCPS